MILVIPLSFKTKTDSDDVSYVCSMVFECMISSEVIIVCMVYMVKVITKIVNIWKLVYLNMSSLRIIWKRNLIALYRKFVLRDTVLL